MNDVYSLKVGEAGDGTRPRLIAVANVFNPAKVCAKVID
jgi:hypothetical protein|nr:MAG TPA: hypothetical protein [Crassvirales sp.]